MQAEQRINQEKERLLNQNNGPHNNSRSQSVSTKNQHELEIEGVKILFPFEPYQCQLTYMQKVIEALQKGSSALLESPTGTGKTLSLLCSVLAWRENLKNNPDKLKEFEMTGDSLHKRTGIPNIIYSTRTHSQLNQCVQELKVTAYTPRIAILGSREQLCVHPKVSQEKGSKQNAKCRAINSAASTKKCWFKMGTKHMDSMSKSILSNHILDVEDLHLLGKDQQFCPYYHSIENCKEADIIFMPYNYLIDANIRPPTVNINNSIVIFDEAHNIESVCCDSVSFELKAEILAQCIAEVQQILELNKPNDQCLASKEDLTGLKKILLKLEEVIEQIPIPTPRPSGNGMNNEQPSVIHPGAYIFEILEEADINQESKDNIIDVAQDVLRELVSPEAEQTVSLTTSNQTRNASKYGLETFVKALQTIFSGRFNSDSFKVHLTIKKQRDTYFEVSSSRHLSLWCFNPGIAICGLKHDVHAMILTSGTLSPLQSFSSELQISFPIRLENKHLISAKQVYIGVLEKGPCSRVLSSEYTIRNTPDYMKELGNSLVNIARRIPFGMLVFFASYKHMEDCIEFWHKNRLGNLSIMEQLQKNKHVVTEPRGGGQSAVKLVFEEYSNALQERHGAMLMAVMRGKVSEGMDFSDNFARCVVICGIPYPYMNDPKIKEKRNYMDQQCCKHNHQKQQPAQTGRGQQNEDMLFATVNGQTWYQQQATRAVNQAIGRVIRHRHDYGCIILADRRFARPSNQKHVSSWIRPFIQTANNFGLLTRDLNQFFKNAKQFDEFMKKPKQSGSDSQERFTYVKVKRELQNLCKHTNDKEVNEMLDAQGLAASNENDADGKEDDSDLKRFGRKRKFSDIRKMQRFISTPQDTPSMNLVKKRKVNIAYDLNSNKPTISADYNSIQNPNNSVLDYSFHGNTPTVSSKLREKMFKKEARKFASQTQSTQLTQDQHEMDKIKARKLRLQNAHPDHNEVMSKTQKKSVLSMLKKTLSEAEYNTFRSTLRLLSEMKTSKSTDMREFDENIVTAFRALFGNPKRQHFLHDLEQYIPKHFKAYYKAKLMDHDELDDAYEEDVDLKQYKTSKQIESDNSPSSQSSKVVDTENDNEASSKPQPRGRKRKADPNIFVGAPRVLSNSSNANQQPKNRNIARSLSQQIPISNGHGNIMRKQSNYPKRARLLTQMVDGTQENKGVEIKKKKEVHHRSLDDSFVKLRKLQDENADVSKPVDKHKRKRRNITKSNGFDAVVKSLLDSERYEEYQKCLKEWRGVDANNINFVSNKRKILNNILNIFVKQCRAEMASGHLSHFRTLSSGFDKLLTKTKDKRMYQELFMNIPELKNHLNKLQAEQQSRA